MATRGADLGPLDDAALLALAEASVPAVPPSSIDVPLRVSLLPDLADGWSGRPGLELAWADRPRPVTDARRSTTTAPEPGRIVVESVMGGSSDDGATRPGGSLARVVTEIELTDEGVLRARHTVHNAGPRPISVTSADVVLPIPARAQEILDFTGLWSAERRPQRGPLRHGVWSRETRHGRPGHDDPFLLAVGTPGFGFRSGEVWATHLAWSGDKRLWAESSTLGRSVVGSGELLAAGEVVLADGEAYVGPWTVAVWSDAGLDGLSARLHPWIRRTAPAARPRPVVLNTWEAVYFDHDLARLETLADLAARVGVERFVLDDGWFRGRTDDRRALGDWTVDPTTWPQGLHPLADLVRERGMDLGLWVEPEMVSPDSELARAHPDWVLGGGAGPTWRHQRVLDLANPAAYAYLRDALSALLDEYPIAFLKWDHNRDLLNAEGAHAQTSALYRLLGELRAAHPGVEIESCASGGARIDLGILPLVDRVWTSDTNDPLERQAIQRWTGVVVPPEYLGGHLGAATAHTTGRTSSLAFRLATAFFGSAGIEWDLTAATEDELDQVAGWIAAHRARRDLLHSGAVVHADTQDGEAQVHGVVGPDAALFAVVALTGAPRALRAPIRLVGLDPDRSYTVCPLVVGAAPKVIEDAAPAWLEAGEITLPGRVLMERGLEPPLLAPEQALLLAATPTPR